MRIIGLLANDVLVASSGQLTVQGEAVGEPFKFHVGTPPKFVRIPRAIWLHLVKALAAAANRAQLLTPHIVVRGGKPHGGSDIFPLDIWVAGLPLSAAGQVRTCNAGPLAVHILQLPLFSPAVQRSSKISSFLTAYQDFARTGQHTEQPKGL